MMNKPRDCFEERAISWVVLLKRDLPTVLISAGYEEA
jgi:hypothetical protein